jgi:hypothetical protein
MTPCVSTCGAAADTVIVSVMAPTAIVALTVAVNPVVTAMPSRRWLAKPGRVNVMTYGPGRRSTILNTPIASVVAVRVPWMRAGLAASTVTPASTAPESSLTTPAILPLATF